MALKSVESKILAGFVSALLLLLVAAGFTYRAGLEFTEASLWVVRTQEVRVTLNAMYSALSNAESAQRAYLLTSQVQQRNNYSNHITAADEKLNALSQLTADNPVQVQNIATLRSLIKQRTDLLDIVMLVFERQGLDAAREELDQGQGMQLMADIRLLLGRMESVELQLLAGREADAERTRNNSLVLLLMTLLAALLLLNLLFVGIRREITERKKSEHTNDSHRRALLLYAGSYQREQILHGLLDLLAEQHPFPVSAFYAYDEWQGRLVREAVRGVPSSLPRSFALDEGLVGVAAQSNRPVLLTPPDTALMRIETGIGAFNPAAVLALPVTFHEQRLRRTGAGGKQPLECGRCCFS